MRPWVLRRQVVLVGLGLVAAVTAATVWMLAQGTRGGVIAAVVAWPVAVAALLVALVGVRAGADTGEQLRGAARRLARAVCDQELAVLSRLMADTGEPRPANVEFRQPTLVYWRVDGGDQRGTLREIEQYYAGLDRGRLVVLGEPGAGKTVLALQLVIDLAAAVRAAADTEPLPRVPVRLSLPTFDPGDTQELDETPAGVLAARLNDWVIQHVVTVHGIAPKVATALVADGWILPVLDGLDEMDPDDEVPRRAAAVIRAVNHPSAGAVRPLVITSRTGRYQQFSGPLAAAELTSAPQAQTTLNASRREVVQDATVVTIEPLTVPQVVDYLTFRFPEPTNPASIQPRWQAVLDRIRAGDRDGDDPLTTALRSPLRLFLAIAAYRNPTSTPDQLTRLATTDQIDEHLFALLVPAALEQHPPPSRTYTADVVTRWLTTLTRHLARQAKNGGSPSDLSLHLLWPAAGWRAPRYAGAALMTFLPASLLVSSFGYLALFGRPRELGPILGLVGAIAAVVRIAWYASRPAVDLRRLDLRALHTPSGRREVGGAVVRWLVGGLVGVLVVGLVGGLVVGLVGGLVGGLVVGLVGGLGKRPSAINRPSQLVQQGVVYTVAVVLVVGLVVGLVGGLVVVADSPWPRYLVATVLLARRRELPRRPAVFLDWAYAAGLMRLSGIAVQFRHREFQTWLASRTQPAHDKSLATSAS